MNPLTNELPPALDQALADFAQMSGLVDYNDVMAFGRAWPSLTDAERVRVTGLSDQFTNHAASLGGTDWDQDPHAYMLASQLAKAVKESGRGLA